MNSLEDPAVHISIEDDEPDIINNDNQTSDKETHQQNQAQQRQQPSSPPSNKRITRSKTDSLPAPISRYSSSTDTATNQWQNYEWASYDLQNSLRKVKILP